MTEEAVCPNCGTSIESSLEGSLDTFVKGYIFCKGCGTRINIEGDAPQKIKQTLDNFEKSIKKLNRKFK